MRRANDGRIYPETWRERAKIVIKEIVDEVGLDDIEALKKALFDGYPFGMRKYYPYRVWLEEQKKIIAIAHRMSGERPPGPSTREVVKELPLFEGVYNDARD
jgi:hypothetical protein